MPEHDQEDDVRRVLEAGMLVGSLKVRRHAAQR